MNYRILSLHHVLRRSLLVIIDVALFNRFVVAEFVDEVHKSALLFWD